MEDQSEIKTVRMERNPEQFPEGPHTADVHPSEVENMAQHGWIVSAEQGEDEGGEGEGDGKGMKVAEIKEALKAKGIEIPAGAKKADLQALLDAASQ